MSIFKLFRKNKRKTLVVSQTYDSPAYKTPQEMPFACQETSWTTCPYVSKRFKQYIDGTFEIEARRAAQNVDADIPWYFDERIRTVVNDAIHEIENQRATRQESIDEIISKKKNTEKELKKELEEIQEEKQRLQKIIDQIGGYDYV